MEVPFVAIMASCSIILTCAYLAPENTPPKDVKHAEMSVEGFEPYITCPTIQLYAGYRDEADEEEEKAEPKCLSQEDAEILMKIAKAEAGTEGIKGKAMVMAVIMNRTKDEAFPDTPREVVFQSGQFSTISNGAYDSAKPDKECHLALAEIEEGNYDDVTALFFDSCQNSWASRNKQYLYTVGNHKFYR